MQVGTGPSARAAAGPRSPGTACNTPEHRVLQPVTAPTACDGASKPRGGGIRAPAARSASTPPGSGWAGGTTPGGRGGCPGLLGTSSLPFSFCHVFCHLSCHIVTEGGGLVRGGASAQYRIPQARVGALPQVSRGGCLGLPGTPAGRTAGRGVGGGGLRWVVCGSVRRASRGGGGGGVGSVPRAFGRRRRQGCRGASGVGLWVFPPAAAACCMHAVGGRWAPPPRWRRRGRGAGCPRAPLGGSAWTGLWGHAGLPAGRGQVSTAFQIPIQKGICGFTRMRNCPRPRARRRTFWGAPLKGAVRRLRVLKGAKGRRMVLGRAALRCFTPPKGRARGGAVWDS